LTRKSKLQISRIVLNWAILTFALALLWSVALNALYLTGVAAAMSLVVPALLGGVLACWIYFVRQHQALEYDDEGYAVLKGKARPDTHKWLEFKECSLVVGPRGGIAVRLYVERDGSHFEIDSSATGADPYELRDFILARIGGHTHNQLSPDVDEVIGGLEREIHRGRAHWIADLNETFKSCQISGETFPLVARGSTRPKGFLLSRFFAMTIMPDYRVAMYAQEISDAEKARSRLTRLAQIIETAGDQKDIKWSWLLVFSHKEVPRAVGAFIEQFRNENIGIACIEANTGAMTASPNRLGSSLGRQMRMHRLIGDLSRKRHA